MKAFVSLVLGACVASSVCHAQKIPVQITVVGTVPSSVKITAMDRDFGLKSGPKGVWQGEVDAISRAAKWFREAELTLTTAAFSPHVPLRLSPETTGIALTLKVSATPVCNVENFAKVEADQSGQEEQLEMFLLARDFHRFAKGACGSVAAERTGKAWFDRSYSLAISRAIFRLDTSSIAAARPRLSAKQVEEYKAQIAARELRFINDQKKVYLNSKKYEWACTLNKELSDTLIAMTDARLVIEKLALDHPQLERDGKLIETHLRATTEQKCWTSPSTTVAARRP
jgi:hypothetical protein